MYETNRFVSQKRNGRRINSCMKLVDKIFLTEFVVRKWIRWWMIHSMIKTDECGWMNRLTNEEVNKSKNALINQWMIKYLTWQMNDTRINEISFGKMTVNE